MSAAAEAERLRDGLNRGERRALARAITLAESTRGDHREIVTRLLERLGEAPRPRGLRVGVSGVPGVGKSTFIDTLGCRIADEGRAVAVLTVDPSSAISGGSILGDKTRMPRLGQHPRAYVRPSPAAGTLGGVARHTRESIELCEAAGFEVVLVETVGVGQSEAAVARMTDVFVLLLLPGGGDELQGIKRGIMELADVILINKADGGLEAAARQTAADYANAVRLLQPRLSGWTVPVVVGSALTGAGVDEVWGHLQRYVARLEAEGELQRRRAAQALEWMWEHASTTLREALASEPGLARELERLEDRVRRGVLAPTVAAERLVRAFFELRGRR